MPAGTGRSQISAERRRMGTFDNLAKDKIYRPGQTGRLNLRDGGYVFLDFPMQYSETNLQRYVDPAPFVQGNRADTEKATHMDTPITRLMAPMSCLPQY